MEPQFYKPDGDPFVHEITAELVQEEGPALVFLVRSDGEDIGEVDVELIMGENAIVTGVGPGEKINNGYLRPASLVIASCMVDRRPTFANLFDINDDQITPLH